MRLLPEDATAAQSWEAHKTASAPRLVLASSGSRELNAAMNLGSLVLLDEKFSVGSTYGCRGTPSAVLIDTRGRIASAFVVGEPGVMGLLSTGAELALPAAPLRANAG